MKLIANESTTDRIVRVVLGVVIAAAGALGAIAAPALYVAWFVAALLLVTGLGGFCPLYALLRIGTARAAR